jgi:hypothetical protein
MSMHRAQALKGMEMPTQENETQAARTAAAAGRVLTTATRLYVAHTGAAAALDRLDRLCGRALGLCLALCALHFLGRHNPWLYLSLGGLAHAAFGAAASMFIVQRGLAAVRAGLWPRHLWGPDAGEIGAPDDGPPISGDEMAPGPISGSGRDPKQRRFAQEAAFAAAQALKRLDLR